MRTFRVIIIHPLLCGLTNLLQIPKYVCVQYGTSVAAIESFYVTVLSRSSNLTTRWAGMDIDISCATTVRSASSSTFITRNLRPLSTTSLTKSIDHVVFGSSGVVKGVFTLAGSRFFSLQRFSKWRDLYTFLWFQLCPCLRIILNIFQNPSPNRPASLIASSTSTSASCSPPARLSAP